MKSFSNLIAILILVAFSGTVLAGENVYKATDNEELFGTWVNMDYQEGVQTWGNVGSICLLMVMNLCGQKKSTYLINGLMQKAISGISTDGKPGEWGAGLRFLKLVNPVKPSNIYIANGSIQRNLTLIVNIIGYTIVSNIHWPFFVLRAIVGFSNGQKTNI